ncbi:solute carrier family 25 member 46-like [Plakobranchus ocellatus]|uniref:Solute carrier family 25 member 46-like n=1 Tax=Plakobranchus ocellatus TaxID=259542 RepID=A0AAV3YC97_9GAST|nr:solute carrier family 25 member 46-like [Plakobranchus ocellatus]
MNELSHERDRRDESLYGNTLHSRRDLEFPLDPHSQNIGQGSFPSAAVPNEPPNQTDQVQRLAGLSIGFCSIFCEQLLSHPCIVLRRQCQIHHAGGWYHLTPFSLLQTVINVQRTQGGLVLWKGLGSVYIVRGIGMMSESFISEVTGFPRDVSRHSSIKKLGGHLLLKGLVFAVTTPFFAASLVETVQSDIASERPGVFDVLVEGMTRIGAWGAPKSPRQLSVWQLALPTVIFRLSHYVVNSIAQFSLSSAMHQEQQDLQENPAGGTQELSVYETYFPDLLASFTGSLLADMLTYPLETVLHRLYVQGTRTIIDNTDSGLGVVPINTRYDGFIDCFTSILKEEGLQGLYRGMGALVLQYATHALILRLAKLLFEKLSQELGRKKINPKSKPLPPPPSPLGGFGEGGFR